MAKSIFETVIYIRTTPKKLWHALTKPAEIKRYWFGMTIESDWRAGSKWIMHADGELMDSGKILEIVPQKRLVRSWRNEWLPKLKAEGRSRCVYEIERVGSAVKFTIHHSIAKPNSKFIEAVSAGWPMIVSNLKSLLETGKVVLVDHPGHD